MTHFYKRYIG